MDACQGMPLWPADYMFPHQDNGTNILTNAHSLLSQAGKNVEASSNIQPFRKQEKFKKISLVLAPGLQM